jgi:hypothetical protein
VVRIAKSLNKAERRFDHHVAGKTCAQGFVAGRLSRTNGRKLCAMSVAVSLSPGFSVRVGADASAARSKFLQYKPQIHPLNVKW